MRAMLALVAAVLLVGGAEACTEIIYKDKCSNNAVISGRTLYFPVSITPVMSWVPKNASLTMLDIAPNTPSTFGKAIKANIAFVCTTHARAELAFMFKDKSDPINAKNFLWCVDGMNKNGLSVAVLYQSETHAMNGYSKDSSKKDAINFMNLGGWALARHSTVDELKRALGNTQVVWNPQYEAFGKGISGGSAKVPTLHMVFHDTSGASLVVQWRDGNMEVLDNPLGVFANDPLLQENYKHFEAYRKQMFDNPAGVYPSVKKVATHDSAAFVGAKDKPKYFWPVPGDYSGPSRFTRLALMKEAADSECWGAKSLLFPQLSETLSPAYVFKGAPAANQAMLTVMGILNTVYLPRGVSDAGIRGPSGMPEFTLYSTIRDHDSKVFYYRTANNPLYKAIDFNKVDWAGLKGSVQHSHMVFAEDPWFKDYSNEYKKGIWGSGSKELITEAGRRLQ